jgi:tRNA-dihydrouridine synthase
MLFKGALLSAPMASVTDVLFREICEFYGGADLYLTEMISAPALLQQGPLESYYCDFAPCPEKTVAQLVGGRAEDLVDATRLLLSRYPKLAGIDINMGCSAPLIMKKKAGLAWMSRTEELPGLLTHLRSLTMGRSFSLKFRIGVTDDETALSAFLDKIVRGEPDFVTFHGRTKKDKFSRNVRWDLFAKVRESCPFPVVANGDISSLNRFSLLMREHDPYAVMLGRAAARSPWVFSELKSLKSSSAINETASLSRTIDYASYVAFFTERLFSLVPEPLRQTRIEHFTLYLSPHLFWGNHLLNRVRTSRTPEEAAGYLSEYFVRHPEEKIKMWAF